MMPLITHYCAKGFRYTPLSMGQRSLIYAQHGSQGIVAFEVHRIRFRPQRTIKGVILPPCIRRPTDEDFGHHAWSFSTLVKAREKFEQLEM